MTTTLTGYKLYCYFTDLKIQGYLSTDPNTKYFLPDRTPYTDVSEVEDWFIRMAEQIKSERQQIIINNLNNEKIDEL